MLRINSKFAVPGFDEGTRLEEKKEKEESSLSYRCFVAYLAIF